MLSHNGDQYFYSFALVCILSGAFVSHSFAANKLNSNIEPRPHPSEQTERTNRGYSDKPIATLAHAAK